MDATDGSWFSKKNPAHRRGIGRSDRHAASSPRSRCGALMGEQQFGVDPDFEAMKTMLPITTFRIEWQASTSNVGVVGETFPAPVYTFTAP